MVQKLAPTLEATGPIPWSHQIEGNQYLNWEDYLGWRGRRVKGNITSGLSPGLAGVPVEPLGGGAG